MPKSKLYILSIQNHLGHSFEIDASEGRTISQDQCAEVWQMIEAESYAKATVQALNILDAYKNDADGYFDVSNVVKAQIRTHLTEDAEDVQTYNVPLS